VEFLFQKPTPKKAPSSLVLRFGRPTITVSSFPPLGSACPNASPLRRYPHSPPQTKTIFVQPAFLLPLPRYFLTPFFCPSLIRMKDSPATPFPHPMAALLDFRRSPVPALGLSPFFFRYWYRTKKQIRPVEPDSGIGLTFSCPSHPTHPAHGTTRHLPPPNYLPTTALSPSTFFPVSFLSGAKTASPRERDQALLVQKALPRHPPPPHLLGGPRFYAVRALICISLITPAYNEQPPPSYHPSRVPAS